MILETRKGRGGNDGGGGNILCCTHSTDHDYHLATHGNRKLAFFVAHSIEFRWFAGEQIAHSPPMSSA